MWGVRQVAQLSLAQTVLVTKAEMLGKSVLLYTSDRRGARPIITSLRAAGNELLLVDQPDDAVSLMAACAVDLAVIDCADTGVYGRLVDGDDDRVPMIALARDSDPDTLLELVCLHGTNHVLAARNGVFDALEVVTTVEKILRRDVFGADKYLHAFGVDLNTRELRGADDRDDLVSMVVDYVASLGLGKEVSAAMGTIADELATNAVYNAPRLEGGEPRYAHVDRREKIELDPWEYATVQFGCDGRNFILSVSDEFGALSVDRVRSRLRDCLRRPDQIEQKAGGAGIGLYTVFQHCNQLVFNLSPGRRTEVIAIADVSNRMKGIRQGGHSLHVFDETLAAAKSSSIELSEAMRSEMREAFANRKKAPEVVPLIDRKPTDKVVAPLREELSGQIVVFPQETLGIDTMLGLIRGCTRRDQAIELGLRFLTYCYEGAVAYELRGRELTHWFASGQVYDWERARSMTIDIDHPGTLASIGRSGGVEVFTPTGPMDEVFSEILSGASNAPGLAVPIRIGSRLRYVLYAYAPKYGRHMARRVRAKFRDELQEVLDRIAQSAAA